jgi:hypothetical protein
LSVTSGPQNGILSANWNFVMAHVIAHAAINMERKMSTAKKAKKANLTRRGGGPEEPSGKFWAQWIEPKGAALLSQMLGPCYFVVKNLGPGNIWLAADYGDLMDVRAGHVRATYARGTITVENRGEEAVLIEFEFLPIYLKP